MKSRIYTHAIELWFTCIFTSLAVIDNCYWRLSTLDTELTKQAILNYRRELWWVFESKVVRTYVIINIWHVNVYVIRTYPQFYHDLITMRGAMPTHLGANPRNHVKHYRVLPQPHSRDQRRRVLILTRISSNRWPQWLAGFRYENSTFAAYVI